MYKASREAAWKEFARSLSLSLSLSLSFLTALKGFSSFQVSLASPFFGFCVCVQNQAEVKDGGLSPFTVVPPFYPPPDSSQRTSGGVEEEEEETTSFSAKSDANNDYTVVCLYRPMIRKRRKIEGGISLIFLECTADFPIFISPPLPTCTRVWLFSRFPLFLAVYVGMSLPEISPALRPSIIEAHTHAHTPTDTCVYKERTLHYVLVQVQVEYCRILVTLVGSA